MAHLTKPTKYDIDDSNIALLGSELEKNVREHAGDKEAAWDGAGREVGIEIWRIESFKVVSWPKEKYGSFYDGDSYLILHTYKKNPNSDTLSYDLHFWLGTDTTQDEAGTAAYKTVELDDHLHGLAVQYREVQGSESSRFLSYFPRFLSLHGGVSTGFHHVSQVPLELFKLYRIGAAHISGHVSASHLHVREVAPEASSLAQGDVFVLDKGTKILQFNTKTSVGKEKFKAAEFVSFITGERKGHCDEAVYDEAQGQGYVAFLSEFGINEMPPRITTEPDDSEENQLFRLSDSTGTVVFEPVPSPISRSSLSSDDVFLLDATSFSRSATVYVWIGKGSSLAENRLALQYAQNYLHSKRQTNQRVTVAANIVKMREGLESEEFLAALEG